jgi:hypothetical protein
MPSAEEVEAVLATELEAELLAGGERSTALARELVGALEEIQAAQVMVTAAVEQGDRRVLELLGEDFAALEGHLAPFGPLLTDLSGAAVEIQQMLRTQNAEHRHDRQLAREQMACRGGRPRASGPSWSALPG